MKILIPLLLVTLVSGDINICHDINYDLCLGFSGNLIIDSVTPLQLKSRYSLALKNDTGRIDWKIKHHHDYELPTTGPNFTFSLTLGINRKVQFTDSVNSTLTFYYNQFTKQLELIDTFKNSSTGLCATVLDCNA